MLPDESNRNGRTIMLAHGHAARFAMLTGIKKPSGPNLGVGPYRGNYGKKLAQKGFITAVVCERAFEERRDHYDSSDPCNVASFRAETMGYTLPMLHILDVWRMTDFLETLPGVNPARIGISGLSGGGTLSYLGGAYDERYKAVAVFCGLCRYLDYALGAGCGMQVVPGLFPVGETGEILSLIAPRPLLLAQGRLDATFNVVRVKSIAADAMRAYQAAGVPANLKTSIYELAHQYDVDIAERFFLESL
jgi:dienelactone hydrolase